MKELHNTYKQPKVAVYEGVRSDESARRSGYERIGANVKHPNLFNCSAIVKDVLDIPKNADTRDTNAVIKMCSAYLKLLYPHVRTVSDISPQEFKMVCFDPAFEKRKIIRQQLSAIDREFTDKMPDIKVRGL